MEITFVGSSSCIPDAGRETASFVINGKHLVDTGWCAALRMREFGLDPMALDSVILTHLHQDHSLGLPAILFYQGLLGRDPKTRAPLRIFGPGEHLERVVNAALAFLQFDRFPELAFRYEVAPLKPGDRFEVDGLRFQTMAANHVSGKGDPEPALAYRVAQEGGPTVVFTGDTHPHPPLAAFAGGADLLIHDGAHTPARTAAIIAREAVVSRLILTHYPETKAAQILAEARDVFPNTFLARDGMSVLL